MVWEIASIRKQHTPALMAFSADAKQHPAVPKKQMQGTGCKDVSYVEV